jgi:hypothetical protein
MPRLNHKLINYMKKLVNLSDHCLPDSVHRQTRKLVNHLKWPHVGIQPGCIPQLPFLNLRALLHLRKNLLILELPWTSHQLFLHPRFLSSKKTGGFKTVTYRKTTATGAPAVITVKHHHQPLIGLRNSASLPNILKNERFKAHFVLTILISL